MSNKDLDSLLSVIGRPTRAQHWLGRMAGYLVDIVGGASALAGVALVYLKEPAAFIFFGVAALCYFWKFRTDLTSALVALIFTLAALYVVISIFSFFIGIPIPCVFCKHFRRWTYKNNH